MRLVEHLIDLQAEAARLDERRVAVLIGERDETYGLARRVHDALHRANESWVAIGALDGPWELLPSGRSSHLLGRTLDGLVIDMYDSLRPNTIGQSIGAVRSGGLILFCVDDLDRWLERPLSSDERFTVYPYDTDDVTHRFRHRFVSLLKAHQGISILDVASDTIEQEGFTGGSPLIRSDIESPGDGRLTRCLTADQRRCVRKLDALIDEDEVLVIEAHRGRGKSSAAGLSAAGFAEEGYDTLITGPGYESIREVFNRAHEWLNVEVEHDGNRRHIDSPAGGAITYHPPDTVLNHTEDADVIMVDEAAAIPVGILSDLLDTGIPIAFLTTVHGYEGTGRGFSVRFKGRLEAGSRPVRYHKLTEPIRYAPGDPIEIWQFRALLLDATPPPAALIDEATTDTVAYEAIDRDELVEDEARLRELFGLLVLAHYRTEPDDLARLLDAPNITIRALTHGGHPVSVALLAEEGRLDETWCDRLYRGESIRGHMIPDLLTTQLRDRHAGRLGGIRYLRITTHQLAQSRGFGSKLLGEIHTEFTSTVDWIGAGFGMTPDLLRFWHENEYCTVHLGTSRNPRSGEHSAVMMDPLSPAGASLVDRHRRRLLDRVSGQLTDSLRTLDPETVCVALETIGPPVDIDIADWMWEVIQTTPDGPGQIATAPEGFRNLAIASLATGVRTKLTPLQRELLVRRVLQSHEWPDIMHDHPGVTRGDARRTLQGAIAILLDHHDVS